MAAVLKGSGQPTGPNELPREGTERRYSNPRQSQYSSDLGQPVGFICRGERQEMRRGGEGRGSWGEQYPRNTAVPANVLQQSYRAPGLQMHHWGCWLVAPLLGSRSSTWGPHRLLSEGPEASSPACQPSSPAPQPRRPVPRGLCSGPHQIVLKAGSKGSGERPKRRLAQL